MKSLVLTLGVLVCLSAAAPAQTTAQTQQPAQKSTTQSANRIKQSTGVRSITGCVDQQGGQYVIRNAKTDELLNLSAPGDPDSYFARFVGHEVQASGTEAGSTLKITQIGQVADMCGQGK